MFELSGIKGSFFQSLNIHDHSKDNEYLAMVNAKILSQAKQMICQDAIKSRLLQINPCLKMVSSGTQNFLKSQKLDWLVNMIN